MTVQKNSIGAEKGTRYGWLVVEKQITFGRKARILFKCDCGNLHETLLTTVKQAIKKSPTFKPRCKSCIGFEKSRLGMQKFDPTRYMQKKFARLLVTGIAEDKRRKRNKTRLVCLCDCGSQAIVIAQDLTNGHTTSCGCFHTEQAIEKGKLRINHGHARISAEHATPIYKAWLKIRAGCLQGWRSGFHLVCHEYDPKWDDFNEFYKDFGSIRFSETISRIDNQSAWSKENCFVNLGRRVRP